MSKAKLTPRQRVFALEYIVTGNATKSAIRAGYKKDSANAYGQQLLTKSHIKAFIEEQQERIEGEIDITAKRVLRELAKIAFANLDDYVEVNGHGYILKNWNELSRDQLAAISSIQQSKDTPPKIKLHDKVHALELIAKHLGMLVDKHEVEASAKTILEFCLATKPEKKEKTSEDKL